MSAVKQSRAEWSKQGTAYVCILIVGRISVTTLNLVMPVTPASTTNDPRLHTVGSSFNSRLVLYFHSDCMQTIRTPEKREQFLKALANFHGNVSKALEAARLSRMAAYAWKKDDADFSQAWDDVVEAGTEELEQEAWRRAHEGWEEPVFYQGEVVGAVRKFSDTLLMFTLKGRKPEKYRDSAKVEVGGPNGGPIKLNVAYDG